MASGVAGYYRCNWLALEGLDAHKYGFSEVPAACESRGVLWALTLLAAALSAVVVVVAWFGHLRSRRPAGTWR